MTEQTDALDGSPHQAEEHQQQSEAPVHHLEQVVEDECQRHIARTIEDLHRKAQPIEQLVGHDVVRRSRSVPMHDQPTIPGSVEARSHLTYPTWVGYGATYLQAFNDSQI
jgi:hypothetical protein